MRPLSADTSPEVHRLLIEGYRRMTPAEKAKRVVELTHATQQMAMAGLRTRHPDADEHELKMRLGSLWVPAELMKAAFGWDPELEGF